MNTLITLEVKFYSAVLCEGLGLGLEFFKKVLTTTLKRPLRVFEWLFLLIILELRADGTGSH